MGRGITGKWYQEEGDAWRFARGAVDEFLINDMSEQEDGNKGLARAGIKHSDGVLLLGTLKQFDLVFAWVGDD